MSATYCDDLPTGWETNPCVDEKAGIIAGGYIHKSVFPMLDPEDGAEWTADIAAGDTIPIYQMKGNYPGESFNEEEEGYGETMGRTTGASHEVTWSALGVNILSGGVAVNLLNAERLNKAQGEYYFYLVTGNYDLRISTKPVRSLIKDVIPESKKDDQAFEAIVKWDDFAKMTRYTAPEITYIQP